jgi:hypothetical protein
MHTTVYGTKCSVVYGVVLRWPGLRRNTARFRAVSHRKRPYTAKLRLKIRLSVIIDPGSVCVHSFPRIKISVGPAPNTSDWKMYWWFYVMSHLKTWNELSTVINQQKNPHWRFMLKRCRIEIDVETINRTSFLESEPLVHCKEKTMLTGKIIINKKVRNPTWVEIIFDSWIFQFAGFSYYPSFLFNC